MGMGVRWGLATLSAAALAVSFPYLQLGVKLVLLNEIGKILVALDGRDVSPWNGTYTDESCILVAGEKSGSVYIRGGEDLALWRDGIAFASGGDLSTTFYHNASGAEGTGIFAVDMRGSPAPRVKRLELRGMPSGALVVGHGIHLCNKSSRLYLINHGDPVRSHVDIFAVAGTDFGSLSLTLVQRVSSDLLPYHTPNDVVEGRDADEIFVSRFRALGSTKREPAFGPTSNFKSFMAKAYHFYLGPGWGELGVLRCVRVSDSLEGGWSCSNTEAWGLPSANGLAISPDRRTLLVSVPEAKQIFRYEILQGGHLRELAPPIQMYGDLDNLEWDEATGQVLLTTGVEGGVELLAMDAAGALGAAGAPDIRPVLRHNASKLPTASAGVRYGAAVLVGSPFDDGLLFCSETTGGSRPR